VPESQRPAVIAPVPAPVVEGERALLVIRELVAEEQLTVSVEHSQTTARIPLGRLIEVAVALRNDPRAAYEMPVTMTCIDWPERDLRFQVEYLLRSLVHNDLITLAVAASEDDEVPSLAAVFPGMEWHERECFDLFGLKIVDHPNLTRILLPDDWEGHPLRKDYVSFGEPVAFTHNLEWALSPQDRPEYLPGAIRGAVERP